MSNSCSIETGGKVAFLVGAGRSGTTLLYKLLCLHAKVAYISNYDNRVPGLPTGLASRFVANLINAKVNAWFNRGGNAYFVNRPWVKKLFPTPVEGEAIYDSCGIPLFPPTDYRPDSKSADCLRRRFERIRRTTQAQVIISKRTANNRRLPLLDSIFPAARYIHLIRDGREVAHSLSRVEWWDGHTLWWDGRTAAQMELAGEERLTICARNWTYEMRALQAGLENIASERVLEVRYEQLLADPSGQLGNIIRFLGLSVTTEFQSAIESLQLTYRPGSWSIRWSPDQLACVLHEEQSLLSDLGYL